MRKKEEGRRIIKRDDGSSSHSHLFFDAKDRRTKSKAEAYDVEMRRIEVGGNFGEFLCYSITIGYVLCYDSYVLCFKEFQWHEQS